MFNAAAQSVIQKWRGLSLEDKTLLPTRMDSAILLKWAPACFQKLWLDQQCFEIPGMLALLYACTQLGQLNITCSDVLTCSQIDALLARRPDLGILCCQGWYVPSVLPLGLNELEVNLADWSWASLQHSGPVGHAKALLSNLAPLRSLVVLSLELGVLPQLPAIGDVLPLLECVSVSFILLDDTAVDLSWLQRQPIELLSLDIAVSTGDLSAHQQLLTQLQAMPIHQMTLRFDYEPLGPDLQSMWADLSILDECNIYAYKSTVLEALPRCSDLYINLGQKSQPSRFVIQWVAVSRYAGEITISTELLAKVRISGCGVNIVPEHAAPWQLTVDKSVQGLTAPHTMSGSRRVYKNKAAHAAGWP